jgi:hypothetical protein
LEQSLHADSAVGDIDMAFPNVPFDKGFLEAAKFDIDLTPALLSLSNASELQKR